MHIGRNNPRAEYFKNGEKLLESETERHICLTIYNNLKPSKQCSEAVRQEGQCCSGNDNKGIPQQGPTCIYQPLNAIC